MSSTSPIQCEVVLALVPTFVDDEVTDGVGSTVRRHLMDCPACRKAVQEEQTLRQWFVASPEVEVPEGFAARVARRAFAGDVGLIPAVAPRSSSERELHAEAPDGAPDGGPAGRVLAFSRALVAVAAAGLVVTTLLLSGGDRPEVAELDAGNDLQEALMELDEENQRLELELDAASTPAGGR